MLVTGADGALMLAFGSADRSQLEKLYA